MYILFRYLNHIMLLAFIFWVEGMNQILEVMNKNTQDNDGKKCYEIGSKIKDAKSERLFYVYIYMYIH